jgi:two-component system response regulator FlrC
MKMEDTTTLRQIKGKILIVDDEQIIRNVLKRKLESTTSYKVFTADDGVPALDLFQQETIDLVVSDLLMKQMNGIELLRKLKTLAPQVPVIIITGYGTVESAVDSMRTWAVLAASSRVTVEA